MKLNVIKSAITNMQLIEFSYEGSFRSVEPHLIGLDDDGDQTLSAWQVSGGSGQGWRRYHIDKIFDPSPVPQYFSNPRPGYNPNDSTMSEIFYKI